MSGKKKCLGTVVECVETGDEQSALPLLRRIPSSSLRDDVDTGNARVVGDRRRRETFGGSLLSLGSLIFSRDRSR